MWSGGQRHAFAALYLLIDLNDVKGDHTTASFPVFYFIKHSNFTTILDHSCWSNIAITRPHCILVGDPGDLSGWKLGSIWGQMFLLDLVFLFRFHPGVRRMWTNVPQTRVWMEASASTTWTDLSVCAIWITQGYTAKWTSATSTCMSSWACGRTSFSWCPTSWYASTMSRKLSGGSRLMIRPLLVHFDSTGLNLTVDRGSNCITKC